MFMIAMFLALVGYVAFPTAPPRYLPEWGFSDTVASFVGDKAEQSANVLYNPFAAVPSMHVAFALMIGVPASRIVRHRPLKVLWLIYPVVITFVVVVTANHFWLDAALGAARGRGLGLGGVLRARPRAPRGLGVAHGPRRSGGLSVAGTTPGGRTRRARCARWRATA